MTATLWPIDTLRPIGIAVNQAAANVKGSPSLSGLTQRMASDAGRWRIAMKGVHLKTKEQIRCWRALEARAEGQLGQIIVEIADIDRPPEPLYIEGPITHSDGTTFSDGSWYVDTPHAAELAASVAVGATQMQITVIFGDLPEPGQLFSIGVRLYKIMETLATDGTTVTVKVWPPARDIANATDKVEFSRPKLLCRLASDDEMAMAPLDYGRWGAADVNFIEDTGPEL